MRQSAKVVDLRREPVSEKIFRRGDHVSGMWLDLVGHVDEPIRCSEYFNEPTLVIILSTWDVSDRAINSFCDGSQALVLRIKRNQVPSFGPSLDRDGYPGICEYFANTSIIVMPRKPIVERLIHASIVELLKYSTGRLNLVG
jgi:hypothetical protein